VITGIPASSAGASFSHARAPRPHVLATHARRAADLDRLAVGKQRRVAELRAELGIVRDRDRATIDVELRVAARVAAVRDRERDQLLACTVDRLRERGQQRATLRERQLRELARTRVTRVRERRREIVAGRRDLRDRRLGRRVDQRDARSRALRPCAREVTGEELHGAVSTRKARGRGEPGAVHGRAGGAGRARVER
jgi:hypothetical protein